MPETKLTAEEVLAMTEARKASQEMVKKLAQPGDNFVRVDDLVLDKERNERVIMTVPRNFFLTLDDHRRVRFAGGIASVPEKLADHWYVKAHGCKAYSPGAPVAVPAAAPTLLGSDELPPMVRVGAVKRPITDFVVAAAARAHLSIADWNALPEDERRDRIVVELDAAMRADREAADKAREQIKETPIESAKAQIDAAAAPNSPPSPADQSQEGGKEEPADADKADKAS